MSRPPTQLALAGVLLLAAVSCQDAPESESAQVVYLCRETKQLVVGPPQPTPAVNPRTGRPTLVRSLYCAKCRRWRAVPPPDVHPGNPMTWPCPVHRQTMSPEGPLPEAVQTKAGG